MILRTGDNFDYGLRRKAQEAISGKFITHTAFRYMADNLWLGATNRKDNMRFLSTSGMTQWTKLFLERGIVVHVQRVGYFEVDGFNGGNSVDWLTAAIYTIENTMNWINENKLEKRGISLHTEFLDLHECKEAKDYMKEWYGTVYRPAGREITELLKGDPRITANVRTAWEGNEGYAYFSKLMLIIPTNDFTFSESGGVSWRAM